MASPVSARGRRRRRNQKRVSVVVGAAVVAVGIGLGVAKAQASTGPSYRTIAATTGGATRTLTASGTVEPVNQAQASFQVAGSVAAVEVAVGQHVTAGQTLATLDTSALQQQLTMAQANLDTAQARLTEDESGQASSSSSSGSSSAQTASATSGAGTTVVLTAAITAAGSARPSGSTEQFGRAPAGPAGRRRRSAHHRPRPPGRGRRPLHGRAHLRGHRLVRRIHVIRRHDHGRPVVRRYKHQCGLEQHVG